MVKTNPAPTIEPQLFGGYTITFVISEKDSKELHTVTIMEPAAADNFYQDKLARWAMDPLIKWCKCQENLANVQQLTFAGRKEDINKLTRLTRSFLALPKIQIVQAAEFLRDFGIPLMQKALPGKSSRYFAGSVELLAHLDNLIPKLINVYMAPILKIKG